MKFISAIRGLNHSSVLAMLRMFESVLKTDQSELIALGDIDINTPYATQLRIISELRYIITYGFDRIEWATTHRSPTVDTDIMKLADRVYSYLISTDPTIADTVQHRENAARMLYLRLFSRHAAEMARQQNIDYVR